MAKTTDATLTEDIQPFEKTVRDNITVELTQAEFDALVSFCFNIGSPSFPKTDVVTEINKGKYKTGEAKDRKAAIDAIETAFGKWNKSGGVVLDGLTKRRKAEADRFLEAARAELAAVEKAKPPAASATAPGAPAAVKPQGPVTGPALVKP